MKKNKHSCSFQPVLSNTLNTSSLHQKFAEFQQKYEDFLDKSSVYLSKSEGLVNFEEISSGITKLVLMSKELITGRNNQVIISDLCRNIDDFLKDQHRVSLKNLKNLTDTFFLNRTRTEESPLPKKAEIFNSKLIKSETKSARLKEFRNSSISKLNNVSMSITKDFNFSGSKTPNLTPHRIREAFSTVDNRESIGSAKKHGVKSKIQENNSILFEKLEDFRERLIKFKSTTDMLLNDEKCEKVMDLENTVLELNQQIEMLKMQKEKYYESFQDVLKKNKEIEERCKRLKKDQDWRMKDFGKKSFKFLEKFSIAEVKNKEKPKSDPSSHNRNVKIKESISNQIEIFTINFECYLMKIIKGEGALTSKINKLTQKISSTKEKFNKQSELHKSWNAERLENLMIIEKYSKEVQGLKDKISECMQEKENLEVKISHLEIESKQNFKNFAKIEKLAKDIKKLSIDNYEKNSEIVLLKNTLENHNSTISELKLKISVQQSQIFFLENIKLDSAHENPSVKSLERHLKTEKAILQENSLLKKLKNYKEKHKQTIEEVCDLKKSEILLKNRLNELEYKCESYKNAISNNEKLNSERLEKIKCLETNLDYSESKIKDLRGKVTNLECLNHEKELENGKLLDSLKFFKQNLCEISKKIVKPEKRLEESDENLFMAINEFIDDLFIPSSPQHEKANLSTETDFRDKNLSFLDEKLRKVEQEKNDLIQSYEKSLFKATTKCEEVLIDLTYFRNANAELAKSNKDYQAQINKLKQVNLPYSQKGLHRQRLKIEPFSSRNNSFCRLFSDFKINIREEINKFGHEIEAFEKHLIEKIIKKKEHCENRKIDTKALTFYTFSENIYPGKSEKTLKDSINMLEKHKLLNSDISFESFCNKLVGLKDDFITIVSGNDESFDFIQNLSEYILKSSKKYKDSIFSLEEKVKDYEFQLAIERYKQNQQIFNSEKLNDLESVLEEIKTLLGNKFSGNFIESIKKILDEGLLENSMLSEDFVYSPDEEPENDSVTNNAQLTNNLITQIPEPETSKLIGLKQEFLKKNSKLPKAKSQKETSQIKKQVPKSAEKK